jgi:hypothetical protein
VSDGSYYPQTEKQEDRCPACGGYRSSPPLTNCPIGSHYGTSTLWDLYLRENSTL